MSHTDNNAQDKHKSLHRRLFTALVIVTLFTIVVAINNSDSNNSNSPKGKTNFETRTAVTAATTTTISKSTYDKIRVAQYLTDVDEAISEIQDRLIAIGALYSRPGTGLWDPDFVAESNRLHDNLIASLAIAKQIEAPPGFEKSHKLFIQMLDKFEESAVKCEIATNNVYDELALQDCLSTSDDISALAEKHRMQLDIDFNNFVASTNANNT